MALKRINKELTDLGRYVDIFPYRGGCLTTLLGLYIERAQGGAILKTERGLFLFHDSLTGGRETSRLVYCCA